MPSLPPANGTDTPGEIRTVLGFHIRLAHGAAYRQFMETCAALDLTQKQVSALWLVGDHPDMSQTDLGRHMQMDRATTMGIVNRLQARGFVVRGKSANDGRKQTLNLTGEGQAALIVAREAVLEHERWLKSRFTEREVDTLIELLSRIHA